MKLRDDVLIKAIISLKNKIKYKKQANHQN